MKTDRNIRVLSRIFFLVICSFCFSISRAQEQKGVFEYVSAIYTGDAKVITITCKNNTGESFQFHCKEEDKIIGSEELFLKPSQFSKRTAQMIVTNEKLVGVKFNFIYRAIDYIDPANPYCCYRLVEASPM